MQPEYIPKTDIEHIIFEVDNLKLDLLDKILDKIKELKIRSFEFILIKDNSLENNKNTLNFLQNKVSNTPKALNVDYETYLNLKESLNLSVFEYLKFYSYCAKEISSKSNNRYHYSDIEYWKMIPKKLFFNSDFFTESLYQHPIFNKMLFIDKHGNVKQTALGNLLFDYTELNKSTITELNESSLWNIRKDECDVCMDCEYRHMCVDARLPVKKKELIWRFDTECNYNPYICEWKGEQNWMSAKQWRKDNPKWEMSSKITKLIQTEIHEIEKK